MAKPKEGRENEYYKGIIRQQRAEIIRLKRRIRELEKESLFVGYDDQDDIFELVPEKITNMCPNCFNKDSKAIPLEEVNVVGRRFFRCNICNFRTKTEKTHG